VCGSIFMEEKARRRRGGEYEGPYIFKVVLTGGPCGGKSTAMAAISERLTALGYQVFVVPEVATLLVTGGLTLATPRTPHEWMEIQTNILDLQIKLEDTFENLAQTSDKPAVIVCDRGLCDSRAYMGKEEYEVLLDTRGEKLVDLRDGRYDGVFHLTTAAIGAEDFYTTGNNAARSESVEQARELDHRTLEAWLGHRNLVVVDNSTSFDDKITRVVNGICTTIGAVPTRPQRKFLLESYRLPPDLPVEQFMVELSIWTGPNGEQRRASRRTQGGNSSYTMSTCTFGDGGKSVVVSQPISGREYIHLHSKEQYRVAKRMTHFLWEGHYFAINEYLSPPCGLVTVEVEAGENVSAEVLIPPFLKAAREVTSEREYSSEGIAETYANMPPHKE